MAWVVGSDYCRRLRLLGGRRARLTIAARSAWGRGRGRRGGTCRSTRRSLRAEFFHGQFAVAVFIKLLQRHGGIGKCLSIDHTLVIGVQHLHDRDHHHHIAAPAWTSWTARTPWTTRGTRWPTPTVVVLPKCSKG